MATWYASDNEVLRMTQDIRKYRELLRDAPFRLMHEAISGNQHMSSADRRVLRAWLERATKMKDGDAVITDISEVITLVMQPSPLEVIASATQRDDVVPNYAQWIMEEDDGYRQDWYAINKAIIDKWSKSALSYIKERAWKLHREWYA